MTNEDKISWSTQSTFGKFSLLLKTLNFRFMFGVLFAMGFATWGLMPMIFGLTSGQTLVVIAEEIVMWIAFCIIWHYVNIHSHLNRINAEEQAKRELQSDFDKADS